MSCLSGAMNDSSCQQVGMIVSVNVQLFCGKLVFTGIFLYLVCFMCSGGKRSGHIPYRDSKLTRILQNSLGGNARTAIICTISPALSHVEQTRNTLSFATSAKEVTNNCPSKHVMIIQYFSWWKLYYIRLKHTILSDINYSKYFCPKCLAVKCFILILS